MLGTVLLFSLLPALGAILGGTVAVLRRPSERARSHIQHFAAGVVFSVVGVELLPDVMKRHEPMQVIVGFTLGVGAMLAVRAWSEKLEREAPVRGGRVSLGLLVAVAIDVTVDGLLLGIAFAAGHSVGVLLAVALTIELLSLGLAVAAELVQAGSRPWRSVALIAGLSLLLVAGALLGLGAVQLLPEPLVEVALSFGLAALLFLVTEELLVEAHEVEETLLGTASFFLGFLLFLVIGMME